MGLIDKISRVTNKVLRDILMELNSSMLSLPGDMDTNTNYFLHYDGDQTSWVGFVLGTYSVPYWNGTSFQNSNITNNGGNVGINKYTPAYTLDVGGTIRSESIKYQPSGYTVEPNLDWVSPDGKRSFNDHAGETYTYAFNEQVNPRIDSKIDKPASTVPEPNIVYKYAVILDEEGNSVRMLAGNLGKNIYNSDGILSGNRSVNLGSYTLVFTNGSTNAKIGVNKTPVEALDVSGRIAGNGFKFNSTSTVGVANEVFLRAGRLIFNDGLVERTLAYTDDNALPPGGSLYDVLSVGSGGYTWSNRLTLVEGAKQNSLTVDGTGTKYPTVDAVNAKNSSQDSAIANEAFTRSGTENLMLHYWSNFLGKWVSAKLKFVSGIINQLEFDGRMKVASLILPPNINPAVAYRLWSDGIDVYFDDALAITGKLAKDTVKSRDILGDTILDDTYYGCYLFIKANCTITVPNTLRSDFKCAGDVEGLFTATFIEGGTAVFTAPHGKIIRDNMTFSLIKRTATLFRLNGGFTTN